MVQADKKQMKARSLLDSAYDLFASKGVHETSIDDIVKQARVAKGTFYLYFKDKYDVLDRIVLKKSSAVVSEGLRAMDEAMKQKPLDFEDRVLFFTDYVLHYLEQNRKLLSIMYKNLSWGLVEQTAGIGEAHDAVEQFYTDIMERGRTRAEAQHIFYLVIELTGSAAYSTLIRRQPCSLDEIRPTMYETIRRMIR